MNSDTPSTIVLKFGSSVLSAAGRLPVAVAEIYRHYREGARVVAVVSAFEGVTDALLGQARAYSTEPEPGALAALISTGEIASASSLALALQQAGIPSRFVDPRDIELVASGERLNGDLTSVGVGRLKEFLDESAVLVIPGFFARSDEGGVALLGRGGSDLTALYLADTLRTRCILLKDVDGVYEMDPALHVPHPRRFILASYRSAETHAGPLIQRKALRFASERGLTLDVTSVGSSFRTRILDGPTTISPAIEPQRIKVALLGLGTVGGGVLEYLKSFPRRFDVVGGLVRTTARHLSQGIAPEFLVSSFDELLAREPDVLVEALPGENPARAYVARALDAGLNVVTANKAMLAGDWPFFISRLSGPRRQLRFSAAVGGGVPMLEAVERLKLRSPIARIRGILNGTCNFILDRCQAGDSLEKAVALAQTEGYAEANPTEDLCGLDSARKIEILGRLAFGDQPECKEVAGIEAALRLMRKSAGSQVRLVAEAEPRESGFVYCVRPERLHDEDFLARTAGAQNRLEVWAHDGTHACVSGLGAGRVPTATAMFADLLEHARVIDSGPAPEHLSLSRSALPLR